MLGAGISGHLRIAALVGEYPFHVKRVGLPVLIMPLPGQLHKRLGADFFLHRLPEFTLENTGFSIVKMDALCC